MPEPLEAELNLEIRGALDSVDDVGRATVEALERAGEDGGAAIETSLTRAGEEAAAAISDSLAGIPPLDLDVNMEQAFAQLDLFNADATTPVVLPIEGDTENAVTQLDLFVSYVEAQQPAPIPIEADTSDAEQAVSDLSDVASGATGDVTDLSGAVSGLQAASGLATGSAGALGGAVGGMGGEAAIAVGATVAIGGAVKAFYSDALSAAGATQRFEARLGDMAVRVEELRDIEGLNDTLGNLALQLGSDDDALRQVVATQYSLAVGSGVADEKAAAYTETLASLAARAVALNPNLGAVDTTAQSLGTALSRGGRFASRFGLDLSTAEISAKALEMTGKDTAAQLTFVEKSMAGAALAAEKYGDHLQRDIAEGSKNPIIQQRALKQIIDENIEAAGAPLVMPLLQLLEQGIPIFQSAGRLLSIVGQVALPIISVALEAVLPIVQAFADGLEAIGPDMLRIIAIALSMAKALDIARTALAIAANAALANPWVLLAVGVTTLIGAIGIFNQDDNMPKAVENTNEFSDAVLEAGGVVDDAAFKIARSTFEAKGRLDALTKSGLGLNDVLSTFQGRSKLTSFTLKELGDSIKNGPNYEIEYLIDYLERTDPALGAVIRRLQETGQLNQGVIRTLRDLNDQYDRANRLQQNRADAGATENGVIAETVTQVQRNVEALIALREAEDREAQAKQSQTDALTDYIDALLAQQDKQFAATKAAQDAATAEEHLRDVNKDVESSELDKQVALNESITAHEKAAIAAAEGALAGQTFASAEAGARAKIDETINALEIQKSQVEYHGPVWWALDAYQRKIQETPEYWLTHLDLVVSAFSGPGGGALANSLGAAAGGAPADVPFRAEGGVIRATAGGQLVNVAEGGYDEIIVPTDDHVRAAQLLREGGLGGLLGARAGSGASAAGGNFTVQINVTGVSTREDGYAAGQGAADGFRDGLVKRGIVMAARTGGG